MRSSDRVAICQFFSFIIYRPQRLVSHKRCKFIRFRLAHPLLYKHIRFADIGYRGGKEEESMAQSKRKRIRSAAQPICQACGCADKFDFNVPDELWKKVVPNKLRNQAICLECFDEFAFKKGIDYSDSIETLYFAGNQATFQFQTVTAHAA
jgi:hypothetical protein